MNRKHKQNALRQRESEGPAVTDTPQRLLFEAQKIPMLSMNLFSAPGLANDCRELMHSHFAPTNVHIAFVGYGGSNKDMGWEQTAPHLGPTLMLRTSVSFTGGGG